MAGRFHPFPPLKQSAAILICLAICTIGSCRADEPEPTSTPKDGRWKLKTKSHGVSLYTRPRAGSSHKEFKAIGVIAAASRAVYGVLTDVAAYPNFMPYTEECRIVRRDDDSVLEYQRLSLPWCSPRDYTLRICESSSPGDGGLVYRHRWRPAATGQGPAEQPGVVRVKICEGGWLLEPRGPRSTLATYSIFTDSGGSIPAFITNHASQIAIPRIFEAIRKQVQNPKYLAVDR